MFPEKSYTQKLAVAVSAIILSALLLPACAGKKVRDSRPEWIHIKSGAIMDTEQKAFYGIGKTDAAFLNTALAGRAADKLAREEIKKIFSIYSGILVRDFIVSILKDDPDQETKKLGLEERAKSLSVNPLTDITIVDRWTDHSNHVTYSLARLDLDRFKRNIQKSDNIEPAIRDFIRDNAEEEFDKMDQARRRGQ